MVIRKAKPAKRSEVNFKILIQEMIIQIHKISLRNMFLLLYHQPTVNATPVIILNTSIILN